MGIELRLPNIKGTDKEQLVQIRSYLYQLTEQLQWALNNVNASAPNIVVQQIPSASSSANLSTTGSGGGFDAEVAFDALKPFIIKSADIVEAYYDEINSILKGQYVAQSDFGTFIEQTEANITATSTYVDQQYSDVQVIISEIDTTVQDIDREVKTLDTTVQTIDGNISALDSNVGTINSRVGDLDAQVGTANEQIGDLNSTVTEVNGEINTLKTKNEETVGKIGELNSAIDGVNDNLDDIRASIIKANAYIRSGLLYYADNAIPVYGLEIGQNNTVNGVEVFNKYARFTSDKLSFYDKNDTEVAYISDYKLYITNVQITGSLQEGGYKDFVDSAGGIVTKWVGGA